MVNYLVVSQTSAAGTLTKDVIMQSVLLSNQSTKTLDFRSQSFDELEVRIIEIPPWATRQENPSWEIQLNNPSSGHYVTVGIYNQPDQAHEAAHQYLQNQEVACERLVCDGFVNEAGQHQSCDGLSVHPLVCQINLRFSLQDQGGVWYASINNLVGKRKPPLVVFDKNVGETNGLDSSWLAHQEAHEYIDSIGALVSSCGGHVSPQGEIYPCGAKQAHHPLRGRISVHSTWFDDFQASLILENAPAGIDNWSILERKETPQAAYEHAKQVLSQFERLEILGVTGL